MSDREIIEGIIRVATSNPTTFPRAKELAADFFDDTGLRAPSEAEISSPGSKDVAWRRHRWLEWITDQQKIKRGFVVRGISEGEKRYLSSRLFYRHYDLDDAWLFEELPMSGHSNLDEFAAAEYRDHDGIRRTGPWQNWPKNGDK